MLKKLFSSEARILLMNQFLLHPNQEFYLRQLATQFNLSPRAVSLELQNLESIGLISKRVSGKQHYYSVDIKHPLFKDLQSIFIKTIGISDVIKDKIGNFTSEINFAFIYGSIAQGIEGPESDVDLLIIGEVSSRKLSGPLSEAGAIIYREINFSVLTKREFLERLKSKNIFVTTVFAGQKIFIWGDVNEFKRLGEKWLAEAT